MAPIYLQAPAESEPPELENCPSRVVLVAEQICSDEWRSRVCSWLLRAGCLYFMSWGINAEEWHDAVDEANLKEFNFGKIPEGRFVMTTWHHDEPLREVFWFAKLNAFHSTVTLERTLILHVSAEDKFEDVGALYVEA